MIGVIIERGVVAVDGERKGKTHPEKIYFSYAIPAIEISHTSAVQ
jgi:hypothetical protein